MKCNLYPRETLELYKDYRQFESKADFASLPLRDKIISIDCEMVTTTHGTELARVTVVDFYFNVLLDELVMPAHPVTDYLT